MRISENENIKVSIIIPTYNSKFFLEECISSALNQSFRDIEVVCVDAGSTDGTLDIIAECQKKDSRISIVSSAQKSYGYQIQLGIEKACGEYVGILESDDYIEKSAIEQMYKVALDNDLDVLKTEFSSFVDIDGNRYFMPECLVSKNYYNKVYCPKENPYFFTRGEYVWNGLYKRSLFSENQITINPSPGAAFQDKGLYLKTMYYARRVMWAPISVYRYRRDNPKSSTYNTKAINYALKEYRFIFDFLRDNKEDLEIRTIFFWKMFNYINRPDFITFRPYYLEAVKDNYELVKEIILQVQKDGIREFDINYRDSISLDFFLNNKELYFTILEKNAEGCISFYKSWLENLKKKPSIVIFGAGTMGKQLAVFLKANNITIKCLCDNDKNKQGTCYGSIEIHDLEDILDDKNSYYIISIQESNFDVEQQLLLAGITAERIERFRTIMYTAMCVCEI